MVCGGGHAGACRRSMIRHMPAEISQNPVQRPISATSFAASKHDKCSYCNREEAVNEYYHPSDSRLQLERQYRSRDAAGEQESAEH